MRQNTPPDGSELPDLVPIGVIGRPFGLRGEFRLRLFNPTSETLSQVSTVLVRPDEHSAEQPFDVVRVRRHQRDLVVTLKGIESRTKAEALQGSLLLVERSALPALGCEEFYDVELVGLRVVDPEGSDLGLVVAIEHPPSTDVLVIRRNADGALLDVPLIAHIVLSVDTLRGVATVDLPEGIPTRES